MLKFLAKGFVPVAAGCKGLPVNDPCCTCWNCCSGGDENTCAFGLDIVLKGFVFCCEVGDVVGGEAGKDEVEKPV